MVREARLLWSDPQDPDMQPPRVADIDDDLEHLAALRHPSRRPRRRTGRPNRQTPATQAAPSRKAPNGGEWPVAAPRSPKERPTA